MSYNQLVSKYNFIYSTLLYIIVHWLSSFAQEQYKFSEWPETSNNNDTFYKMLHNVSLLL